MSWIQGWNSAIVLGHHVDFPLSGLLCRSMKNMLTNYTKWQDNGLTLRKNIQTYSTSLSLLPWVCSYRNHLIESHEIRMNFKTEWIHLILLQNRSLSLKLTNFWPKIELMCRASEQICLWWSPSNVYFLQSHYVCGLCLVLHIMPPCYVQHYIISHLAVWCYWMLSNAVWCHVIRGYNEALEDPVSQAPEELSFSKNQVVKS